MKSLAPPIPDFVPPCGFLGGASINVVVNQYLEGPKQVRFPRKGPYYQRREKRMRRDPKNWAPGDMFMMGNTLFVHPADWPRVKQSLVLKEISFLVLKEISFQ